MNHRMPRRNDPPPEKRRVSKRGPARWLLNLSIPVLLLIPAYPSLSAWWFQIQEPIFLAPVSGASLQIREDPYGSGQFGARRSGGRSHRGVDLVAPIGTSVRAAKSGTAVIGKVKDGMGNYVVIQHPGGFKTRYGHLKSIHVQDGQWVGRGERVGAVGKSGNAGHRLIQPHVHFEIWNRQGQPVDPLGITEAASNAS